MIKQTATATATTPTTTTTTTTTTTFACWDPLGGKFDDKISDCYSNAHAGLWEIIKRLVSEFQMVEGKESDRTGTAA